MHRARLIWREVSWRRDRVPWQQPEVQPSSRRSRLFTVGAPLALLPVLLLLPVWVFTIHAPRFAHARAVGAALLLLCAACAITGISRLVRCLVQAEFDLFSAMSFGVLLITFVVLLYSGMLMFAIVAERTPALLLR